MDDTLLRILVVIALLSFYTGLFNMLRMSLRFKIIFLEIHFLVVLILYMIFGLLSGNWIIPLILFVSLLSTLAGIDEYLELQRTKEENRIRTIQKRERTKQIKRAQDIIDGLGVK